MPGRETLLRWTGTEEARRHRLQFTRIERMLEGTAGAGNVAPSAQAAILGLDPLESDELRAEFETHVAAGAALLDAGSVAWVRSRWIGRTISCYGDSITADRQSWAELLRAALGPDVRVHNHGRAGDTTADLIARFHDAVAPTMPDAVIVMIGTNDARRYSGDIEGRTGYGEMLVGDVQTSGNLRELQRLIDSAPGRRGYWLTPPPVIDDRIASHPSGRLAHSLWSRRDIARKADLVRTAFPHAVDTARAFAGAGPLDALLLDDGLHPSLSGQVAIARCVVALLGADPPRR